MAKSKPSATKRKKQAGIAKQIAELKKYRAAQKREIDRQYREQLKALKKIGAYKPASAKLTKARKTEIRKRFSKFEEFLTGDRYIYIPILARKKSTRKRAMKLADQNQIPTAPKGVFIERHGNVTKARARRNRKTGSYDLIIEKIKRGKRGSKTVTEIVPMAPMGALGDELKRIKEDVKRFGKLKENERIAFKVTIAGHDGYSHKIFSNADLLAEYLTNQYAMNAAFKLQFFQSLSVQKTKVTTWFKKHPIPKKNVYRQFNKTGRSKPIYRRKKKITAKRVKEGWGVFIDNILFEVWADRKQALAHARELRENLK